MCQFERGARSWPRELAKRCWLVAYTSCKSFLLSLTLCCMQDSVFSFGSYKYLDWHCCNCTSPCVCKPTFPSYQLANWLYEGAAGVSLVQLPGASATLILENVILRGSPGIADYLYKPNRNGGQGAALNVSFGWLWLEEGLSTTMEHAVRVAYIECRWSFAHPVYRSTAQLHWQLLRQEELPHIHSLHITVTNVLLPCVLCRSTSSASFSRTSPTPLATWGMMKERCARHR